MVHGLPAVLFVVVFQQREVGDPAVGQQVRVDQVGAFADLEAQVAKALRYHAGLVGHDQDQVANFGAARAHDRAQLVGRQELGHLRTQRLAGILSCRIGLARHTDPDQPLGPIVLDKLGQLVDLRRARCAPPG